VALQAVEGDLEDAIERLRAKGVTPDARAAELTALFGVVNALALVATGLARVLDALGLPGGGSDTADR
jgi:translation elongation factor EF-Ts